ncbi:hypothetical protein AX16_002039 [Volvariella volvacea WC 439]|uniref:Guanine-nucleotide exchange factor Cdc24 n=1 Tax=Volvariella volvacea TaxID=36659 RepID=A0A2H4V2E3_9AGAR|nr:guanine-nucleotide exchange factor Cdc24 [Volvariella volvacea]KAF8658263.1 hypothetical protein AX16_002039 [Volvariella volvacea WC 439]
MASAAGRKKSIVSTQGLQIDTPVANNTLLNKAASSSTSLYQQCSSLRSRLMRIRGFPHYFSLISSDDSRRSTDPVTQLWDLFSIGIPLCYIFDQLSAEEGFAKINHSQFDPDKYEANPDRVKKHAIALFAMQVRNEKVMDRIPGCEPFTVTDLWNRDSTDGLVKVVNTVTAIVEHLPEDAFDNSPPSPTLGSHDSMDTLVGEVPLPPATAQEAARNNIVREMVETERKYVQDLEVMQKYANALAQGNIIDQDTIHLLFPNLNKLVNFQRKFLIRFESAAELSWQDQRWGQLFLDNEDEFIVYEPYCANYTNASELMLANEQALSELNHMINVKGELPAFLIKPVQRVCKYPLLLDSLVKATSVASYPHFEELKRGSDAAKRIADKINEAQRRAENEQTVRNLRERIEDWKGHHLENFGDLLLDDIFVVTKSDIDREYHVFLFEKIILCCKEALPPQVNGARKVNKTNSILKKQAGVPPTPGPATQPTRKNTPLLLKGRIFLGNVTQAVPMSPRNSMPASAVPTHYPLAVWWKGDDDLEFFTLRCRREDQMRQWESAINRLIKESAQRRALDRVSHGISRVAALGQNSTNPAPVHRQPNHPFPQQPPLLQPSQQLPPPHHVYSNYNHSNSLTHNGRGIRNSPYGSEEQVSSSLSSSYGHSYPAHDGFDFEPEGDEDDYEDYPPTNYPSGRGTPMGNRRHNNAMSLPAEREPAIVPERPRAHTEDVNGPVMAQWRNNGMAPPPLPSGSHPRSQSIRGNPAYPSETYTNGAPKQRPALRSQFSSTRLKATYDANGDYRSATPDYRNGNAHTPVPSQPTSRSRSASQPSAYVPKSVPPPLPASTQWNRDRANTSSANKRGSGSSQSTGDSSEYSPNSSSPITPYGSSESSLAGVGIRPSRSQGFDNAVHHHAAPSPQVKVKVHFHEDIFVIQVPRHTEYDELVEKVGRKIRLCGPRRDDGPLRVKYVDEDGDMVSLGSTEDVQMAFEQWRPGGQVTLYVT